MSKGMKKIGERNWAILENGLKTVGLKDAYSFIEEQLYIDEADTIREFLEWLDKNDLGVGWGNYELRFKEFLKSKKGGA